MPTCEKSKEIKLLYDKALEVYMSENLVEAQKLFEDLVQNYDDNPSKYFLESIKNNHMWGVHIMKTK